MVLVVDTTSNHVNDATPTTTLSWSHTCATSANLIVVMYPESRNLAVVSVTYGGDALSLTTSTTSGNSRAYIYSLANPRTGTNTVTITVDTSTTVMQAGAVSFIGADTSAPTGATNTKTGTAQNKSITLTTTQKGSYVVDCIGALGGNHTAGGTQTTLGLTGNRVASYNPAAVVGENGTSWTVDSSAEYSYVIAEVKGANTSKPLNTIRAMTVGNGMSRNELAS